MVLKMKILSIETSCDETAITLLEATGGKDKPEFTILGNGLMSQIEIHKPMGGVVPMLAKRAHGVNLVPILLEVLDQAGLKVENENIKNAPTAELARILEREPELLDHVINNLLTIVPPDIDAIAVTSGPGLEPALWVGINFAKALGLLWNKPVIAINHMEGHVLSALMEGKLEFPALALLISGGHTELVVMEEWLKYQIIGETRDDAVGEAFDKFARMMGLPYPGGPEISKLASLARERGIVSSYKLPRPMIHSDDFAFSFAGLKTAALYTIKKIPELTEEIKIELAREFEDAVVEVLTAKAKKALVQFGAKTLILGGGVTANKEIRRAFEEMVKEFPDTTLLIPDRLLSTDNAVMIGMAAYLNLTLDPSIITKPSDSIRAEGNLRLG
jgi:N6-L-threonylcarbamoyladenine synthase